MQKSQAIQKLFDDGVLGERDVVLLTTDNGIDTIHHPQTRFKEANHTVQILLCLITGHCRINTDLPH